MRDWVLLFHIVKKLTRLQLAAVFLAWVVFMHRIRQ